MNVTAIISEYNPLHKGHLYHIETARKETNADYIIAIMSGNFVQRGTPAIQDKYTRAEAALKSGVDLVLELPAMFATASAEYFALGGVSLANTLGCVTHLSFGSEYGEADKIMDAATIVSIVTGLAVIGAIFIVATSPVGFTDALFETSSALATVGLTAGVTPGLSLAAKLMIIVFMYFGRVGILTISLGFLMGNKAEDRFHYAHTNLLIG
jgi:hypothetical protein